MKTIEELAQDYVDSPDAGAHPYNRLAIVDAYIAGAKNQRKELTRWRNPKEELPVDDTCVICKVDACEFIDHLVLNRDKGIWWTYTTGVSDDEGWHVFSGIVVGWRPIHE